MSDKMSRVLINLSKPAILLSILVGHSPSVQTETGGGDTAAEQLLQRHHTSEEEAERPHCVTNRVCAVHTAGLSRLTLKGPIEHERR